MSAFRKVHQKPLSLSSELTTLYIDNPAKFQRLLAHLIIPRFKIHRLHIDDVRHSAYIDILGEIVTIDNENKLKFPTITEWYNHVRGTSHARRDVNIFNNINLSKRVSVASLVSMASPEEIAEFTDMKYRAFHFYGYIYRQIRARQLALPWSRDYSFDVTWKDQKYNIHMSQVKKANGYMGCDLLDAFESGGLTDFFWRDEAGEMWALTDHQELPDAPQQDTESQPLTHQDVEIPIRLQHAEANIAWLIDGYQYLSAENTALKAKLDELTTQKTKLDELTALVNQQRVGLGVLISHIQTSHPFFSPLNTPFASPLVLPLQ